VVLLPVGEDPDSFSRKLTSEEFRDYIGKHEQNFIRFKTELLMREAEDDPIKRAQLVTNVMQSVSIIPDRILRAEYIKECSTLLKIKEEILYDEVRKKILSTGRDFPRNYEKTNPAVKQSAHMPAFVQGIYSQANEREILYFLLNYGNTDFSTDIQNKTPQKVAQYIINEIQNEELEFQNLIYRQIYEDFEKYLADNEIPQIDYFLHHTNQEIRSITAEIISPTYELSKLWKKRGSGEGNPEDRLSETVPEAIVRFKFKILEQMIAEIDNDISQTDSENSERFIELFTKKGKLDEVKIQLKTEAGDRIIL
jgi:DNA primase